MNLTPLMCYTHGKKVIHSMKHTHIRLIFLFLIRNSRKKNTSYIQSHTPQEKKLTEFDIQEM